jgi:large subunit ribosomal protein L28
MPRACALTGTHVRYGRNVSHSNRKTSRTFEPNLQRVTLTSEALGRGVSLRITTRALRTVQRKGGIDAFLLSTPDAKLAEQGLRLKRRVRKAASRASKKPAASS